jgi:quercetin dioxygenase-like cupin family protein
VEKTEYYTIVSLDEAEGVPTSEGFVTPLVAYRTSSLSCIEIAPGEVMPSHVHNGLGYFEIIIFILEGELEVMIRNEVRSVGPFTAIQASPDEIGWANRTDKPVKMLLFHAPPPRWKSAEECLERMKSMSS